MDLYIALFAHMVCLPIGTPQIPLAAILDTIVLYRRRLVGREQVSEYNNDI